MLQELKNTLSCVLGLCLLSLPNVPYADDLIKKSNSGICHPTESNWYERTKEYEPFGSLGECLASGGRLPQSLTLAAYENRGDAQNTGESDNTYSREQFGSGWADVDGDCQDSRAEALIGTSSTPVVFSDSSRCRVVRGRWISPFTGKVIQNASSVDIDHIVPLRWAWAHGARDWSDEKRKRFANDPRNLWPVELSLNRSKGARGPSEWLPPSGQCQYISRFLRLIKIYNLGSNEPETIARISETRSNQC